MKHILLSTAALAGLALAAAAPAAASEPALQLGVSGYAAGYAVYTGGDDMKDRRRFDFRKHSEVYLSGEVALDNGITAGAHFEILADRTDDGYDYGASDTGGHRVQESYIYLSSSWGRINFGEEDGAAYLLQVAAPSADSNIDGLRPIIGATGFGGYAQDPTGYSNKFTYITPVFNGFQAAMSFTPTVYEDLPGLAPAVSTDDAGDFENAWELAARYEGSFDSVDLALGAGYSHLTAEEKTAFNTSRKVWNIGANFGFDAIGAGVAYKQDNVGIRGFKERFWVAGADYTIDAYKLGLSYARVKETMSGVSDYIKGNQWTVGGVYEWGPGMTFRGAVQYVDLKADITGQPKFSEDRVQVTLGTQLNF